MFQILPFKHPFVVVVTVSLTSSRQEQRQSFFVMIMEISIRATAPELTMANFCPCVRFKSLLITMAFVILYFMASSCPSQPISKLAWMHIQRSLCNAWMGLDFSTITTSPRFHLPPQGKPQDQESTNSLTLQVGRQLLAR